MDVTPAESTSKEVAIEQQVELSPSLDHSKRIVTAHGDAVAKEALGDDLPPRYFQSGYFLGTSLVSLPCQTIKLYHRHAKPLIVDHHIH
jgi:hypothetical protein